MNRNDLEKLLEPHIWAGCALDDASKEFVKLVRIDKVLDLISDQIQVQSYEDGYEDGFQDGSGVSSSCYKKPMKPINIPDEDLLGF